MRTPRLPVVDWTEAPADLNGLVLFAERRNLVSARVPSHLNWSLLSKCWVNPLPSGLLVPLLTFRKRKPGLIFTMHSIMLILNKWHELWITAHQKSIDIKTKWHCLATKGQVGRSEKQAEIPDEAGQFSVRSQSVEPALQPSFLPNKCGSIEMFSLVLKRPERK
jgi:hypothetical protein